MRTFKSLALAAVFAVSAAHAAELKIGAWNLEHLNDSDMEGCEPRIEADYAAIREQIEKSGVDLVAFQEVENLAAARRVFPEDEWAVEISSRPETGDISECWDWPGRYLKHLATGFAIRRGIEYSRNDDLVELALGNSFARWGTDITIGNGAGIRMLSIHLKTGCWSTKEDGEERRAEACKTLRKQLEVLNAWIEDQWSSGRPFFILGDFNRNLAVPDDWGWNKLSSTSSGELHLLTRGIGARCDPRYKNFIDHLVAGPKAKERVVPGSFEELPNEYDQPDHCLIAAKLTISDQ